MTRRIDLCFVGAGVATPDDRFRTTIACGASPGELAAATNALRFDPGTDAVLFLDPAVAVPDPRDLSELLDSVGDVWHAGPALGLADQPRALDYVQPTWMLNLEGPDHVETTSWRVSFRAALVRRSALSIAGIDDAFGSLAGAGLDWGLTLLRRGAVLRSSPLFDVRSAEPGPDLSLTDEVRIIRRHWGRPWAAWAATRRLVERPQLAAQIKPALAAAAKPDDVVPVIDGGDNSPPMTDTSSVPPHPTVSVLVPTIERYPYLHPLLRQLGEQTVAPLEVIVVDQTPKAERESDIAAKHPGVPITYIEMDVAGQCSSRNAGIEVATGELILFLDDDDEVPTTIIEDHLEFLRRYPVDASCGSVTELDGPAEDRSRPWTRVSEIFPTNNAMLRRSALSRSGLFDLNYDRGARADHDLGMRLHLSGALLMHNPDAHVVHHHAPRGGLRHHNARVTTRSNTLHTLVRRNLRGATDYYLADRYYTPRQARESAVINTLVVFRGTGPLWRRLARVGAQLVLLPSTLIGLREARASGHALIEIGPRIPQLDLDLEPQDVARDDE